MPIYEYECDKCGAVFEAMQAISAKPLKTCNGLGCDDKDNGKVRRLVSASGFILKGSGWYTSEYPSEARKQGWEKDSKQGKTDTGTPAPAPTAEASTTKAPEPAAPAKKPSPKSPYSGSKAKKAKGKK
ncbi:MAG: zinc ribbon domain-containing protein [Nitrospinae bacterium]|nr:zinc ribbon domain-containing protein [Nitrospinota bacterium]MBL7021625.1 zinc ribbon domain-containing protein [Nitrospinaceae bacterium]